MPSRISRRILAQHVADSLRDGDTNVITQLAAYLIDARRTNEADLIVRDVESALAASGVIIADIISARDLSEELKKAVVSYVTKLADASEVHVRTDIDESLLGGVRVQVPGAEYDGTVRRQLTKLQAMKV